MIHKIRKTFSRFVADESANLVAETVIILPLLVSWYVGSLIYFNAYEARNVNQKAAYTLSDMISREDGAVNAQYIEGLDNIFDYLTAGHGTDGRIRVTTVRCVSDCDANNANRQLAVDWSYGTDGLPKLTDGDIDKYQAWIPVASLGERLILVETFVDYFPGWTWKRLDLDGFANYVVTSPRFVPQIPWASSGGAA